MKPRKSQLQLTPEQKAMAYTAEQLGEEVYEKLKDDPNYQLMCFLLMRFGLHAACYMEALVPESGDFRPAVHAMQNYMWHWEDMETLAVQVTYGHTQPDRRILMATVPFEDGTGRMMNINLTSGTLDEILCFLRGPEFGPAYMKTLDRIHDSLRNHD